jgi:hypothetical protein
MDSVERVQQALNAAGFKATIEWGDPSVEDPSVEVEGTGFDVQVSLYTADAGGIYTVGWWQTPEKQVYRNSPLFAKPEQVVEFICGKGSTLITPTP